MKKTRPIIVAALLLALLLSLCACGKSEAAANAEALIANIGQVTLENRKAVASARTAFDALSSRRQSQVENVFLLLEAERRVAELEAEQARLEAQQAAARAEVCQWLGGQWVDVYTLLYSLYDGCEKAAGSAAEKGAFFSEDGTCLFRGTKCGWEFESGVVTVQDTEYTLDESQGYPILRADIGDVLVPRSLLEDVFVTVELTGENVNDYIELVDMPYRKYNDLDELESEGTWVWLKSRVYWDGLVFLIEDDLSIEAGPEGRMNVTKLEPFGPMWDDIQDSTEVKAADCSFGRVEGTLYFVKSEYAEVAVSGGVRHVRVLGLALDRWHDPQYIPMRDSYVFY